MPLRFDHPTTTTERKLTSRLACHPYFMPLSFFIEVYWRFPPPIRSHQTMPQTHQQTYLCQEHHEVIKDHDASSIMVFLFAHKTLIMVDPCKNNGNDIRMLAPARLVFMTVISLYKISSILILSLLLAASCGKS